jgi:hypothetical protein
MHDCELPTRDEALTRLIDDLKIAYARGKDLNDEVLLWLIHKALGRVLNHYLRTVSPESVVATQAEDTESGLK